MITQREEPAGIKPPSPIIPRRYRHLAVPPGPKQRYPFEQMFRMFRRGVNYYLQEQFETYGNMVQVRFGPNWVYLCNEPEITRQILLTEHKKFIKGVGLQRARIVLGNGLLTNEGASHMKMRRLVQPAFHRPRLENYAVTMLRCAEQVCDEWEDGAEVDMAQEMMRLTLLIVGWTLFNADVEDDSQDVGSALSEILGMFPRLMNPIGPLLNKLPLASTRRLKNAMGVIDKTIQDIIDARRKNGEDHGDLLSMLLLSQNDEDGSMSDRQVRDEALTLFLAGHETTANALAWTWYLLSQNPEVERKLHEELDTVLGNRPPTYADYDKLAYTRDIITESMRLYPPAYTVARQAIEDVEVGGYTVPRGAMILMSIWYAHRDPRYYDRPNEFDPDRWTSEFRAVLPKFAYFPFGGGPRVCIGEGFAWIEAVMVLATLAQHWRAKLVPGHPIETQAQITLRPRHGIKMTLEKRK